MPPKRRIVMAPQRKRGPPRDQQGKTAAKTIFRKAVDYATSRYRGGRGAANLMHDLSIVKSLINTEEKHIDTIITATTASSTTPANFLLNAPGQGTDSNQRTGRSIKLTRIDIMFQISWNPGASTQLGTNIYRFFLVRWKKTPSAGVGTGFAIGDFLDTDYSGTVYGPTSQPDPDNAEDFQILHQDLIQITPQTINGTSGVVYKTQRDVSVQVNFHQVFGGTTAASLSENSIQVVVVAQLDNGAGGASQIVGTARIRYIDN